MNFSAVAAVVSYWICGGPNPGKVEDALDGALPAIAGIGASISPIAAVQSHFGMILPNSMGQELFSVRWVNFGRGGSGVIDTGRRNTLLKELNRQVENHGRVTSFPDLSTL